MRMQINWSMSILNFDFKLKINAICIPNSTIKANATNDSAFMDQYRFLIILTANVVKWKLWKLLLCDIMVYFWNCTESY